MLWFRQKFVWLVLIASLAFNAGVGVTYGVRAYRERKPEGPTSSAPLGHPRPNGPAMVGGMGPHGPGSRVRNMHDRMLRQLGLDPATERNLRDSRDDLFRRVRGMREALATEHRKMADLVADPESSRETIIEQLLVIEQHRTRLQEAVIDHFLDVRDVLTSEQRGIFLEMIHDHLAGPGHGPGPMLHGLGRHIKGVLGNLRETPRGAEQEDSPHAIDGGT